MHTVLSNFLANVWENRDHVLAAQFAKGARERVYELYSSAPPDGGAQTPEQQNYANRLAALRGRFGLQPGGEWFYYFHRTQADVLIRLYMNPRPEWACRVFEMTLDALRDTRGLGAALQSGAVARAGRRPGAGLGKAQAPSKYAGAAWADGVNQLKIANAAEAYSGRRDLIVVYLAGQDVGWSLLRALEGRGLMQGWFADDVPPMTQRVYWGVSFGTDPREPGASFGMVRCDLIADALILAVTGHEPPASGPIVPARRNAPQTNNNRLGFVKLVTDRFAAKGISVERPWN
jgi:hypothetical protein